MDNSEYERAQELTPELIEFIKHQENLSATSHKKTSKNFSEDKYSGLNLFQFDFEELPKLIDPIFPEVGLVSVVGSSDTGKSTFLRQLALSIAFGLNDFIGYKIGDKAKSVIYVSTEDDPTSTSISIKKQVRGLFRDSIPDINSLNNIKFIFDINAGTENKELYGQLKSDLEETGADLIIIDAFTDIFSGDLNSSTKVREFLGHFNDLSKKHNCLILFLHHTGKRTDKYSASKDNVLGSQAFEAKMRVLLELKHYPNDDTRRTLTITKGNYISSSIKKKSKILRFDENDLLFHYETEIPSSLIPSLAKTSPQKSVALPLIKEMHKKGISVRNIQDELKSKGHILSRGSVQNYITELKTKSDNIIEKGKESE